MPNREQLTIILADAIADQACSTRARLRISDSSESADLFRDLKVLNEWARNLTQPSTHKAPNDNEDSRRRYETY